ncbi:MAG: hypothetical protein LKF32_08480 [Mageeibacillus sp.]|jgi:hypothetical protein|nr:hypothetical protein [Mageeibacillus sp.]MCI1264817.1 hypothetical protein [Saccharofermentans sp.]MCI1769803.1 hypothetical protein [Mageeibacillus sp.]MCI2044686.1 hypothetical protein [Mageeibacillus sp.]
MKKLITNIVAAALAVVMLTGCKGASAVESQSEPEASDKNVATSAASSTVISEDESENQPSSACIIETNASIDESQLEVIYDNRDQWFASGEDDYFYAVTDLDNNGRYELVAAALQGTGLYTYANIFEVSEDKTSLVQATIDAPEGSSLPDIITCEWEGRSAGVNGPYYYVIPDTMRVGSDESYTFYYKTQYSNGTYTFELLASEHDVSDDNGKVTVTYGDQSDFEIDEEAFNTAIDTGLDPVRSKLVIGWIDSATIEASSDASVLRTGVASFVS